MAEKILRGPEQRLQKGSFGKVLLKSLKEGKSQIAMVDAATKEDATFKELLHKSISLAQHLKKHGIKKNDAIAISSENCINFIIPVISSLMLGVTIAPINHMYSIREIIHALNLSKPKIVFCSLSVLENMLKAVKEVKCVKKIIVTSTCDKKLPKYVGKLEDFFYLPIPSNFEAVPVDGDHTAAILCSSGTTGLPKGVMLTHTNFLAALDYLRRPGFGNYNSTRIAMGLLPFYHAYGFLSQICQIALHVKSVVLPRFEEKMFLSAIENYKISLCTLVPPLVLFLSKSPLVDDYDLSSLKEIITGAAPLSKAVEEDVIKRLNVIIRQGYGLTEITSAATLQPYFSQKTGTVGVLMPGMEAKIIDPETGKSLGPHESGELCFRGDQIMKGYVGDKNATAATIDKDGWLHSGDAGYYDEYGFFYIVDRLKELIKYKGFQVPPAELEGILMEHKDVLDCAVIGKPDDKAGELPTAFVVKRPNSSVTERDIINFVAVNVSYHKQLHGGVRFVNSIPKNATGKILRRVLREQLKLSQSKL